MICTDCGKKPMVYLNSQYPEGLCKECLEGRRRDIYLMREIVEDDHFDIY